jgi:hypothetical protein
VIDAKTLRILRVFAIYRPRNTSKPSITTLKSRHQRVAHPFSPLRIAPQSAAAASETAGLPTFQLRTVSKAMRRA